MASIRAHRLAALVGLMAVAAATTLARPASADENLYLQTNLVSDIPGLAAITDPDLVNPWGMASSATSPIWVSDNGTGLTTLYNGAGTKLGLVVTIPPPLGSPAGTTSTPTGQVFNSTTVGFRVSEGGASAPARFIFATEDGTISGWAPSLNPTNAIMAVDNSATGAVYKGLTIAPTTTGALLFAANFHNNTVEVYDEAFHLVAAIKDMHAPADYAPFNVQYIGSVVVVTYAKQDADAHDDVAGPGNGLVDVIIPQSLTIHRIATGTGAGGHVRQLNSPWGVALAPASFGHFGGRLLIGNFGDGRINAFNIHSGARVGSLRDADDHPLTIDGLWGLRFGNGGNGGQADVLYFTAGLDHEQHGLFGTITAVPEMEDGD